MNIEVRDLGKFRQTILQHQWSESYKIASILFAKNVPRCTLLIAGQMTQTYLRFQPRYELDWVAHFAQDITNFVLEGNREIDFPDKTNGTFADAPNGVTSLVSGLVELWESVSVAHKVNEKAKHLAESLNHFIIAELCDYLETAHPDEMHLRNMFWNAPTTADGKKILPINVDKEKLYRGIEFLKQPESIGYHSARLLSIADELEVILKE